VLKLSAWVVWVLDNWKALKTISIKNSNKMYGAGRQVLGLRPFWLQMFLHAGTAHR
jgi:hypothetical protein